MSQPDSGAYCLLIRLERDAEAAIGRWTGGPRATLRLLTAAAGALLVVPVFWLARRLWRSRAAGLVAAAIWRLWSCARGSPGAAAEERRPEDRRRPSDGRLKHLSALVRDLCRIPDPVPGRVPSPGRTVIAPIRVRIRAHERVGVVAVGHGIHAARIGQVAVA